MSNMPGAGNEPGLTPAMRQYQTAKEAYPDALLFFRMGDFYELFYEDAVVASRELQLTLTARDKARSVPMCGVPYHAAGTYLQRLLRRGFKVAICEQMEDPKTAKTVVRREVTRVLTPGTALDGSLAASESRWLASIACAGPATGSAGGACVGVASLDLSTGEFRATEFAGVHSWAMALDELERMGPAEVLSARGSGFGGGSRQASLEAATPGSGSTPNGGAGASGAGEPGVMPQPPGPQPPGPQPPGPQPAGPQPAGPQPAGSRTELEDWVFTEEYAVPLLRQALRVHSLDGMGLGGHPAAAVAAGAVVHYLRATKQGALEHLDTLGYYEKRDCLEIDAVSVRNLELVEPLFAGERAQSTLFWTVDACCTPMGKRLLRAQLLRPMTSVQAIDARLRAVAEAAGDLRRREGLRKAMDGVLDLERLLGRVALDSAGPREVVALGATLGRLPGLVKALGELARIDAGAAAGEGPPASGESPGHSPSQAPGQASGENPGQASGERPGRWAFLAAQLDPLEDLCELIGRTLVAEPPLHLSDGGAVLAGTDAELDEWRELSSGGRQKIAAIEERERTRTGIGSLKVRFNSVFGYYLEVTRANSKAVPADYERKQTLVNAERFTTPELKELEAKILNAQERCGEIERRIFGELRGQLLLHAARLRETARKVAEADLLSCFAHLAAMRGWVRPEVDASGVLEVIAGRHPVVERRLEDTGAGRFVPNSLSLCAAAGSSPEAWPRSSTGSSPESTPGSSPGERIQQGKPLVAGTLGAVVTHPSLLLITGPNMGGKSTYLRQAALLTILAQCGSFVPAERMRLGVADRIFTRIGASDNMAQGRSTFMVEMTETAAILNTATSRSLVLLDEMGRGTATYDGLSLAWAAVEHLHDKLGARTLFATHYHELTLLSERLARLRNVRVAVKERDGGIVFLHTVEAGAASKSYGIEVARLAGLPQAVIERAREVLRVHERAETQQVREAAPVAERGARVQMTLFTPLSQRIVERLESLDVDGLTPREALMFLAELQRELKEGGA